ncbi:glycosyltransferase family 4 protein [Paenibacillus filicis]|uniref:Glycosyltransferase family 4 protein n=1 Tax=Paenibacillus filicis TaxID=669464 RepID=A0ABU9DRH6_9BACL
MNVLMICTEKLPVPNIRGGAIQTYICGVAGFLAQKHSLTILGRDDPELPADEWSDGIRYIRVPSEGTLDIYAKGVLEFVRLYGAEYDIIHIFNRPKLVLPVRELAPGARIILSMHNDMFTPEKIDPQEAQGTIFQTERIITISNYIGKSIENYYPEAEAKTKTIYSGVDLSRFTPWSQSLAVQHDREALRAEHGLSHKKVILFVGRLSRNKGPHVLVRAMGQINHSDAVLVVVGGAWYSDQTVSDYIAYIRALAQKSPLPVLTTGYVDAHQVHRWFTAADIFVCTSIWQEPLARVHYEAMAAGLPFLTTDRGGNQEIVMANNGLLVMDPENPAEYAQKLNQLLSDPDLCRRMGEQGRRLAEERFTWQRVAEDIMSVWERLA